MDEILKVDVNEEEIEPFIKDINRHFEFIDKEDIIKKIISMTFNRFLEYYANAPEIEKPSGKRSDRESDRGSRNSRGERTRKTPRTPEAGYKRLFINLGKDDGFYPGEVMQFINKNVHGRQAVGHIDLLSKFSYIEVPEKDATKVMNALSGATYKGREVRCNDAEEGGHGRGGRSNGERRGRRSDNENGNHRSGGYRQERNSKPKRNTRSPKDDNENGDWRQFFQQNTKLKGEMPDFSEEGWARRKPKKK